MPDSLKDLLAGFTPLEQSAIVVGAMIAAFLVFRVVVLAGMERVARATDNDLDDRLVHFARRFGGFGILFLGIVGILKVHEVEVSPLLAGAGIAGAALAFAAKETIADVLAGVFLIADRPMRVGDRVKIEDIGRHWGAWGDVIDIGLRRTTIRNTDGVVVNYPNAVLAHSVITNFSHEPEPVRVRVRFAVDYDADLQRVREVAAGAATSSAGVRPDSVDVVIRSLWDDTRGNLLAGVLVEVRYRIDEVRQRTRIRSEVLAAIHAGLREAGIPLPASRLQLSGRGAD